MAAISPKIASLLTRQISKELYSHNLYMAKALWFDVKNYTGIGTWFKAQAQEELLHAYKMMDHLVLRGETPEVEGGIDFPAGRWKSATQVWESTLEHEQAVTVDVHAILDAAYEEKDHSTIGFMQWFANEQLEEEASVASILEQVRAYDKMPGILYHLDKKLGKRTPFITSDGSVA
eukprot:TRINITY_DN30197_c0_g1_i1.p1 TRINITY_DN30197_c0_g1~~TRINITY_DN30197_c0_g1_i1.p1  ORF type:complete len:176 (-),score=50.17 TRINITY_DN30197_c0_g1_i1:46-573(-)